MLEKLRGQNVKYNKANSLGRQKVLLVTHAIFCRDLRR
jgi:hypothetical protein